MRHHFGGYLAMYTVSNVKLGAEDVMTENGRCDSAPRPLLSVPSRLRSDNTFPLNQSRREVCRRVRYPALSLMLHRVRQSLALAALVTMGAFTHCFPACAPPRSTPTRACLLCKSARLTWVKSCCAEVSSRRAAAALSLRAASSRRSAATDDCREASSRRSCVTEACRGRGERAGKGGGKGRNWCCRATRHRSRSPVRRGTTTMDAIAMVQYARACEKYGIIARTVAHVLIPPHRLSRNPPCGLPPALAAPPPFSHFRKRTCRGACSWRNC